MAGKQIKKVNFRLLTATNRDLPSEVGFGRFREDLFHRIFIAPVQLPSLKSRGDDILLLADYFLNVFSPTGTHYFTQSAKDKIKSHKWPGNVRELRNTIQRTLLSIRSNKIDGDNVSIFNMPKLINTNEELSELDNKEKKLLIDTLSKYNGNMTKASRELGIARSTFRSKMEKYGLR